MADFESDFAVDSEFGEEFNSNSDSEFDSEPDIIFFEISDPPRFIISPSSNPSLSVFFESSPTSSHLSDSQTSRYIDIILNIAAFTRFHILPDTNEEKYKNIEKQIGVKKEALRNIRKKAKERDYDFKINKLRIYSYHLIDDSRSKRFKTVYNFNIERQIIEIVTKNRNGKKKSAEIIANEVIFSISRQSVCNIIKKLKIKKVKKIIKPGLNKIQKAKNYFFS
jgi:hypothetical protein